MGANLTIHLCDLTGAPGFNALTEIAGGLRITNNTQLTAITGFSRLARVLGANGLDLRSNALSNFDGFASLKCVPNFTPTLCPDCAPALLARVASGDTC